MESFAKISIVIYLLLISIILTSCSTNIVYSGHEGDIFIKYRLEAGGNIINRSNLDTVRIIETITNNRSERIFIPAYFPGYFSVFDSKNEVINDYLNHTNYFCLDNSFPSTNSKYINKLKKQYGLYLHYKLLKDSGIDIPPENISGYIEFGVFIEANSSCEVIIKMVIKKFKNDIYRINKAYPNSKQKEFINIVEDILKELDISYENIYGFKRWVAPIKSDTLTFTVID